MSEDKIREIRLEFIKDFDDLKKSYPTLIELPDFENDSLEDIHIRYEFWYLF